MVEATLGRALKAKGIKQCEVRKTLAEKYDYTISQSGMNNYCLAHGCRDKCNWKIIRECLEKEYGIEYRNGRWEVNKDG